MAWTSTNKAAICRESTHLEIDLAVIGGTGLYKLAALENVETLDGDTAYGMPSGPVRVGLVAGRYVAFIARHGEGHALPPDVAVDAQGAPTTDANAAAAVVPLGGSEFGHKGYALALVIDLLCGPLLGNPYGPHIPPMFEAIDEPRRLGAFFIALDPQRFAGGAALSAQIEAMAQDLAAEPGAPRLPGDPEIEVAAQRGRDGIPIEPGLVEQFRACGQRLGVDWTFTTQEQLP